MIDNAQADDFGTELSEALKKCGVSDQQPADREKLLDHIKQTFVKGNPRAWWTSFKKKPAILHSGDNEGYLDLDAFVPSNSKDGWFVIDERNEDKLLFFVPLHSIPQIIRACRFFEYYIVSSEFSWLIAENDHGDILFVEA
jgi:hypothetical protein